jgi:hypothetical protein
MPLVQFANALKATFIQKFKIMEVGFQDKKVEAI